MSMLLQGAGPQTAGTVTPEPPQYQSGEVGNVDASTVVITFDQAVALEE